MTHSGLNSSGMPRSGPLPRTGDVPRRLRPSRRWLWTLALVIPLVLGLGWWWLHPTSLGDAVLTGDRQPGCLRLVIAADVSGSMNRIAQPRDAAIGQLLGWAPANLRADDELALVVFGETAEQSMAPTPVSQTLGPSPVSVSGASTKLEPLLQVMADMKPTRCRTAVFIVGDGVFGDLPTDAETARQQLTGASVDSLDLLVPGHTDTDPSWTALYPYAPPDSFDGTNANETALVFAQHLARLTGQLLHRSSWPR